MTATAGTRSDPSPSRSALTYSFDSTGAFTAVSDGFCGVLGWRRDELLGRFAPSLVHPEDRGRLVHQGSGFVAGTTEFDPVWRVRHASGDYRWYRIDVTPITDGTGSIVGGTATLQDVDQAAAARDALVESERRYRLLVQNSHDVVAHSVDGVLRWVSPSISNLTGWTPDDLIGRRTLHLWHPEDRETAKRMREAAQDGPPDNAVLRMRRKDGSYVDVDVAVHGDGEPGSKGVVVTLRDATARVAALDALRLRESEFRLIAEHAADIVFKLDLAGRMTWLSPSMRTVLGHDPEALMGRDPVELMHPDDVAVRAAAISASVDGRTTYEARYRHADGSYRWLAISGQPVLDAEGRVTGRVGNAREVGAEVAARESGRRSESMFRLLAENSADVVFRTRTDGVVEWMSPSISRVLGWSPEDVVGLGLGELVHPDDVASRDEGRREVAEGRPAAFLVRYRHKDGRWVWMSVSGGPLLDESGAVVGHIGSARDATAEVEARDALERSEEMFRLLAENSADIVICSSTSGIVEWASPSIEAALGWTPEEMLGVDFADLVHPDDLQRRTAARAATVSGGSATFLSRYRHRDGRWVWLSVTVAPMVDETGEVVGVVGSGRDATFEVEARHALERSESDFRLLAQNSADVVLRSRLDGIAEWVSPSVKAVLGLEPLDLVGTDILERMHPEDRARRDATRDQARYGTPYLARYLHADGHWVWLSILGVPMLDESGAVVGILGQARDATVEVAAREALESSEDMFRSVMDSATVGMAVVGLDQRFRAVNPALCELLGRDEQWFHEHLASDLAPLENRGRAQGDPRPYFAHGSSSLTDSLQLQRADGAVIWVRRAVVLVRDADGEPSYFVTQLHNITAELDNEYNRFHDPLTGLRNRDWIVDNLDGLLLAARRTHRGVGVLFIDLDNFKVVNDSLGHAAGDEVIATVAHRLAAAMRPGDHVGRFGGDEFVVVIPEVVDVPDLERICERVLEHITPPIEVQGHRIQPTASMGVAVSTDDSSAQSLMRDADSALYRAKSAGKQRWHFADEAMHSQAVTRLTVEDELRRALAEHELVVHYQPIVRLMDRETVGYEALVRWQHPERGLVPPLEFLPVAEDSGLIVDIGDEVLRLVCETLVARPDIANISVNMSPLQTSRPWWREKLVSHLTDHGVDPARLSVEVTETAVLDNLDDVARELASLRTLGVGVHLDDFGTGYSSIALLRDLPITGLKLDMSFTRRLTGDGGTTEVLATGLAGLANGLGMLGIAEGVETEEQATLLRAMGWSHGQGWLFGRPAPEPA